MYAGFWRQELSSCMDVSEGRNSLFFSLACIMHVPLRAFGDALAGTTIENIAALMH